RSCSPVSHNFKRVFMIQVQKVAQMHRQQLLGSGIILGTILVLALVATGVTLHRASAQGSGIGLLWTDAALLVVYGFAGIIVWKQRSASAITAAMVGAQIGLVVGAVQIANHLIEAFVPTRPFLLVISPVLLTLALLGTAGAAAWERTGSLVLAVISGVCCAVVATLITLCFAISFNLLFALRVDWQLREAFAASGMIDRAGFRVRNILQASSEILLRMPLLAICLASAGAIIQAWMSRESRCALVLAARFLAPFVFALGTAALWHANAIERAGRPPFVLSGVLLTGIALSAAYPIWSAFHGSPGTSRSAGNS
ncbi:MAG TPA: hypothetical protein VM912_07645, partial [Terriglobales bacterium]|nr:hypothetical protein [Terriglobales bacterium]